MNKQQFLVMWMHIKSLWKKAKSMNVNVMCVCVFVFQLVRHSRPGGQWHPVNGRFSWTESFPDIPADQHRSGVVDGKPTALLWTGETARITTGASFSPLLFIQSL